jgi:hypothetical protein
MAKGKQGYRTSDCQGRRCANGRRQKINLNCTLALCRRCCQDAHQATGLNVPKCAESGHRLGRTNVPPEPMPQLVQQPGPASIPAQIPLPLIPTSLEPYYGQTLIVESGSSLTIPAPPLEGRITGATGTQHVAIPTIAVPDQVVESAAIEIGSPVPVYCQSSPGLLTPVANRNKTYKTSISPNYHQMVAQIQRDQLDRVESKLQEKSEAEVMNKVVTIYWWSEASHQINDSTHLTS